jgi:hypothetical protein
VKRIGKPSSMSMKKDTKRKIGKKASNIKNAKNLFNVSI